jgi:hypothetical protein
MEPIVTKEFIRATGLSMKIVTAVVVIGGIFFLYRTFLDTKLTKLQIAELEKELAGDL